MCLFCSDERGNTISRGDGLVHPMCIAPSDDAGVRRTTNASVGVGCARAPRVHWREGVKAHFWATKKGADGAPTLATQRLQLKKMTHLHTAIY